MSKVICAPHPIVHDGNPFVFLAGSIEMGKAVDWQAQAIQALEGTYCNILNPRRPDWDSSWKQEASNPQFREQVEWELGGLELAHVIFMYLAPGTMSPISLLELGLYIDRRAKMILCCPPGFWRKGNVDIVAEQGGVHVYDDLGDALKMLRAELT